MSAANANANANADANADANANTKTYTVSCLVVRCANRAQVCAADFDEAFFNVPVEHKGWIIRRTPSGEHYEMLCPEHAQQVAKR